VKYDNNYIGRVLRVLRINNDYSQKEIAEHLLVDRSTYAYYESGRVSPSVHIIKKLSLFYNISTDALLIENNNLPKSVENEFFAYYEKLSKHDKICLMNRLAAIS